MITNKYRPKVTSGGERPEDPVPASVTPTAEAIIRAEKAEQGRTWVYERPLPPDSLLRITEDFSPIYEMAFRAGITDQQSRATLRTIERIHRTKIAEMASWTEAMRRAEAEKHRALKRIQDDMEVDQLRAQLKVMKSRLEEKSKELTDNAHFLQQVAALRSNYERERGKQHDMLETSPTRGGGGGTSSSRGRGGGGGGDAALEDGLFSTAHQNTGKKQKLYNALHYSALYDGEESGRSSPNSHVRSSSNTPTPLKVHERYFHQRPAPSLSFSPAKSQLNPLKSGAGGQASIVDTATLQGKQATRDESDRQASGRSSTTPFGMSRKGVP